ncbi:winged helix-turn-helix transcriptional regulator [Sphingobacterium sp. ML3W]|jgi:Predicted transcriptional regulators
MSTSLELEQKKMISRTVFREKPPRVEYILTDRSRYALPVIQVLKEYGELLISLEADNIY